MSSASARLALMKKLSLALSLLVLISQPCFSAEVETAGFLRKLQRGFLNIVLSPMEVSTALAQEKSENYEQMPPSWMSGILRGTALMGGRALVGVYEIATFPFPIPKNYEPVMKPEFTWEKLPKN